MPIGNNQGVLLASDQPLSTRYDLAVLDLDGVVYRGPSAVPGAPEALRLARAAGMQLAFVTNNAARTPGVVAAHLTELGVDAGDSDVVTSAQAAVRLIAQELPAGATVYVIGGEGLERALIERGFQPVSAPSSDVQAVVQGYGPRMPWRQVVDGAILVRSGLPWVASNADLTFPTDAGVGPGTGTLVNLVADFAGRTPRVAGKPEPALFEETLDRVGGTQPIVVGDRLDTDIEGAVRLGWPSLLVFTGVTGLEALVAAPPGRRPTYVGSGLAALLDTHRAPAEKGPAWDLGGWSGRVVDGTMVMRGQGARDDWWRVVASAAWHHLDDTGRPVGTGNLVVPVQGRAE